MAHDSWQLARLIPVAPPGKASEREHRASSAFLAVLAAVRPLSIQVLGEAGATRAKSARVTAYSETPFKSALAKGVRPDGLVEVQYGSQKPFTALFEFKTGTAKLEVDQINAYIDIARQEGFDAVITVSNELSPSIGVHPTPGVKVRKGSKVSLHHFSWTRLTAIAASVHVALDAQQGLEHWLMSELLRYLAHPSSGTLEFDDMGPDWSEVREGARNQTLKKSDTAVAEIARKWDQLLTYASIKLGVRIGADVEEVQSRAEKADPSIRTRAFATSLAESGTLGGSLRIPEAVSDVTIECDLRARLVTYSCTLDAPNDKRVRGAVSWLLNHLGEAPETLTVELVCKHKSSGQQFALRDLREDAPGELTDFSGDLNRFVVSQRRELPVNRRSGKTPGFIDGVYGGLSEFYESTVQHLSAYPKKAPQMAPDARTPTSQDSGLVSDL